MDKRMNLIKTCGVASMRLKCVFEVLCLSENFLYYVI